MRRDHRRRPRRRRPRSRAPRGSGAGAASDAAVAEVGGGDPHLDHPLRRRRRAGSRAPAGREATTRLSSVADEVQGGAVLGRVAGAHPLAQEAVVGSAPLRAGLVVDAVAERQQAEALEPLRRAVEAGHRLGEPAERAGREAAEDDPRFPGLAQDLVDAVRAPDAEQADRRCRRRRRSGPGRAGGARRSSGPCSRRKREMWLASQRSAGEGAVEADDVVVGVAAGRGQEADPRPLGPGRGRARSRRAAGFPTPSRSRRRRRRRSVGAPSSSLNGRPRAAASVVVQRSEVRPRRARPRVQAATAARRRGAACCAPGAAAP